MDVGQWRCKCMTEGRWVFVDVPEGMGPPTECPNDASHLLGEARLVRRIEAPSCLVGARPVPGPNDDISKGWSRGSRCIAEDGQMYVCVDHRKGMAVWRCMSPGHPPITQSFTSGLQGMEVGPGSGWRQLPPILYHGARVSGVPRTARAIVLAGAGVTALIRLVKMDGTLVAGPMQFRSESWTRIVIPISDEYASTNDEEIWRWEISRTEGIGNVRVSYTSILF